MTKERDRSPEAGPQGHMTLAEHLGELRRRLIISILAIAVGGAVAFLMYDPILELLQEPYCKARESQGMGGSCTFIITDPLEGFSTRMKVSGYAGLVLALPVVLYQLWRFITPGLYDRERRLAIPFVVSALLLFAAGSSIAFWTLPKALDFLLAVSGDEVEPFFSPSRYLSLVTLMLLAFGVGFQFPVVLVFLQLVGVLQPSQLASVRRYAWVGIVVLVAVITPSGDPVSLFALSIPMWLFYEISIVIGRVTARRRARRAAAA